MSRQVRRVRLVGVEGRRPTALIALPVDPLRRDAADTQGIPQHSVPLVRHGARWSIILGPVPVTRGWL